MKNLLGKTAVFILAGLICSYAEVILSHNFNGGTYGFTYQDDAFRGTSQPGYAMGAHEDNQWVSVTVGGTDAAIVENMSGAWEVTFEVPAEGEVELQFDYNLDAAPDYESDEYSEILVALDGQLRGTNGNDYVVRIYDGGVENMPNAVVSLGNLTPGNHTLAIGAYNNRKSEQAEQTVLWFDNVVVNLTRPTKPVVCNDSPSDPNDPYARTPISSSLSIKNCGGYYLTQNLNEELDVIGISAHNVSLDLNGYTVTRVYVGNDARSSKVYNGNMRYFSSSGDDFWLDNVTVSNGTGIEIRTNSANYYPNSFKITNSVITNNSRFGISIQSELGVTGLIEGNVIRNNSGDGISNPNPADYSLLIKNNIISSNTGVGINLGSYSQALVVQNTVTNNTGGNIDAPTATLVDNLAP